MKTGFLTYWVPQATADMKACLDQHQRTFSGNQLAIVGGTVKVATLDTEIPQPGATTLVPMQTDVALAANVTITGSL